MAFEPRLRVLVRGRSTSFLLPVSVRTTLWVKGELSVPMMRRAFGPWIKICSDRDGEVWQRRHPHWVSITYTYTHTYTHTHTHTHAHTHTHTRAHTLNASSTRTHTHTHTYYTHAHPHQVGGEVVVPLVLKHQLSKYNHIPKWRRGHIHEHAPAGGDCHFLSLHWDSTRWPRGRFTPTTLAVGTISSEAMYYHYWETRWN